MGDSREETAPVKYAGEFEEDAAHKLIGQPHCLFVLTTSFKQFRGLKLSKNFMAFLASNYRQIAVEETRHEK